MKTEAQIKKELQKIESDERLHYETATVDINAPLALIQISGRAVCTQLRWVLGLPPFKRGQKFKARK